MHSLDNYFRHEILNFLFLIYNGMFFCILFEKICIYIGFRELFRVSRTYTILMIGFYFVNQHYTIERNELNRCFPQYFCLIATLLSTEPIASLQFHWFKKQSYRYFTYIFIRFSSAILSPAFIYYQQMLFFFSFEMHKQTVIRYLHIVKQLKTNTHAFQSFQKKKSKTNFLI